MTYREDFTLPAELLERVSKQGFDILPELIQVIINAAMQAERQQNDCTGKSAAGPALLIHAGACARGAAGPGAAVTVGNGTNAVTGELAAEGG